MNLDIAFLTVSAAFAAQICIISFAVPWRVRGTYEELLRHCPVEKYPHLYLNIPPAWVQRTALRAWLNYAIGFTGFAVFARALYSSANAFELSRAMQWFLFVQVAPVALTLIVTARALRRARQLPPPQVRSADLHRLSLEDCLPRSMAAGAVAIVIVAVATCSYALLTMAIERARGLYLLAIDLLLLWRMLYRLLWPLEFRRPNPHLTPATVARQRRQLIRILFAGGAIVGAASLVVLSQVLGGLRYEHVAVLLSLVIQGQALWVGHLTQQQMRQLREEELGATAQPAG
jgi:hypothetical protein